MAAALAVMLSRLDGPGALLVDLAGDGPAVLGLAEPDSPGLAGWLAAGAGVPADGLRRIEIPIDDRLGLIPRGVGPLASLERAEVLAGLLATEPRSVVIDVGMPIWVGDAADSVGAVLVSSAVTSLLVTRACYLSLRRIVASPGRPSGIVLVTEPGRALGRRDVEQVVGVDVVAEVLVDPIVARAVDAGLLAGRLPRTLERALGRAT